MQKLIIAGNVGKEATLRTTQNGDKVLGFHLAVDNGKDRNGEKRQPTWFDCAIWGERAQKLEPYIVKGAKLTLIGRPTARAHEGKAYLGIAVDDLTFMSSAGDGGGRGRADETQGGGSQQSSGGGFDDDIPF